LSLLLFLSLLVLFIILFAKELPFLAQIRSVGIPVLAAVLCFSGGNTFFMSPLAGLFSAVLGWKLAKWLNSYLLLRNTLKIKAQVKNFVTTATSLYLAGNTTPEVVRNAALHMPEPLAGELNNMLVERKLLNVTFPELFTRLSVKYKIAEFKAVAKIIEAGNKSGGSVAISQGLSRLGDAMRRQGRLQAERYRAIFEPAIGAAIALSILIIIALLDATVWREVFAASGIKKIMLALGIGVITGLVSMVLKLFNNADLQGD
jgi:Flp pilus assembly protein TadB